MTNDRHIAMLVAVGATLAPMPVSAQVNTPIPGLANVDVSERLGNKLPSDIELNSSDGTRVTSASIFSDNKPVLLVFGYHSCPKLCSMVTDAAMGAARGVGWTIGKEYRFVSVSIDPRDTPDLAARKRTEVIAKYGRNSGDGFSFYVGSEAAVASLAKAVGFQYRFEPETGQYAHPAALTLLTPDGRVARYLYGVSFDPNDLKLGLLEASQGRSVTTVEKLILYCYDYDPQGKKYALVAKRVMRVGGAVTVFLLGGFLALLWSRDRKRKPAPLETRIVPNPVSKPRASLP